MAQGARTAAGTNANRGNGPDARLGASVAGKTKAKPAIGAPPGPGVTVGANAATFAIAGVGSAVARAVATAYATGSNSVTRTFTRTYTVVTNRFSEAIAVAVSVATSVFGNAPGPGAGASATGGLGARAVGQAVAHANAEAQAQALASGPRRGTRTVTEAFTAVTGRFAEAVAVSESVAISSNAGRNGGSGRGGPGDANVGHGGGNAGGGSRADGRGPVGQQGGTPAAGPGSGHPIKLSGTVREAPAPGVAGGSQPAASAAAPHSPQDPAWIPDPPARKPKPGVPLTTASLTSARCASPDEADGLPSGPVRNVGTGPAACPRSSRRGAASPSRRRRAATESVRIANGRIQSL